MARLNIGSVQANLPSAPQVAAPAAAFGDGGQGMAQASQGIDQVVDAYTRVQTRADTIKRVRDEEAFLQEVHGEFLKAQTEEDWTDPAAVERFGGRIAELQNKRIGEHGGSADSQAQLGSRLGNISSSYGIRAATFAFEAQQKMLSDTITRQVSVRANEVANAPETLQDNFLAWADDVKRMSPALTEEQARTAIMFGNSEMSKSVIQKFIDKGQYGEARQAMEGLLSGDVSPLTPDDARRLRSTITKGEYAQEQAQRAGEMKVAELRQILGREPTPEERTRYAGVSAPQGKQTLAQQIAAFEDAVKRPATEQEIAKMAGVATAESGAFGAGITGRSLDIMTDNARAFADGLLSEFEERRFIAAVTHYTQPVQFQNPDTGIMETRRPELPPFVQEALRRKGVDPQAVQATPDNAAASTPEGASPEGAPLPEQAATEEATGQPRRPLWQRSGNIAGPIPTAATIAGRTPIVGDAIGQQEIAQDRAYAVGLTNDIVRVLQNSPRFAEMERAQIKKEVGLEPGTFDTPTAFRDRIVAVDELLEERQNDAIKTIQNRTMIGKEDYQRSLTLLNDIANIRARLGVPPRVKSPAESRKMKADGTLQPGDVYLDHRGEIRKVQ